MTLQTEKPKPECLPTSPSLLDKIKNPEDREAWKRFVDRYGDFIRGRALKRGLSDPDADEVVQQVYIAVARNIGQFKYDDNRSFKGWLLRTTGWKIQDVWRQNSRYVELTEATQEELAQQPAPVECDHEWLQHVRVTALDLLRESVSPQTYQIYDCLVLQEMPVKEVTQLFGVSRIRVDLVKFRCKRKLRKLVADIEDGITLGKALRISAFCDRKQGEHTS